MGWWEPPEPSPAEPDDTEIDGAAPPFSDLQMFVEDRDEDDWPRLLGPDGEPIPRPHHRFGFQAEVEWL